MHTDNKRELVNDNNQGISSQCSCGSHGCEKAPMTPSKPHKSPWDEKVPRTFLARPRV